MVQNDRFVVVHRPVVVGNRDGFLGTNDADLELPRPIDVVVKRGLIDDDLERRELGTPRVDGNLLEARVVPELFADGLPDCLVKSTLQYRILAERDRVRSLSLNHRPTKQLGSHAPGGARDAAKQRQAVFLQQGRSLRGEFRAGYGQ